MLNDQWQGFTGLPDFPDPALIPTHLKNLFDFVGARAVPRYTSVAARDAELPSPAAGMTCTVAGFGYVYRGGAWRRIVDDATPARPASVAGFETLTNLTQNVSSQLPVTFPAGTFTSAPSVVTTGNGANPSALFTSVTNVTETGFNIVVRRSDSISSAPVHWIAMARE